MVETYSFGYWVMRRRKSLDLTRAELASEVGCVQETIKKIERDERRPSRQIAALLAKALAVPPEELALFLQVARRERAVDRLRLDSTPLESLPARHHNLPVPSTSFIGRNADMDGLKARLEDPQVRLCTILGPGGIGKTRLGLQVAARLLDRYPGGVWLVELAGTSDPTLLPREILTILGISEQPNRELPAILVDFIQSRPRLLLILDNCEHLLEACGDLSSQLLKHCPNLQVLTSSRQALGVNGEAIWPVTGLSLPRKNGVTPIPEDQVVDPARLPEQAEAFQLFFERARLVQPNFRLTIQNISAIAQICQDLDGMPLAIELAAARLNVLSAEEIASHLDERFQFLRGKTRDVAERHQTLQAVVDWSYQLMNPAERLLFNRLSVFRGGFTLEAAKSVGGDLANNHSILDMLASLVDQSMLLVSSGRTIGTRYQMLETLRLYGQECLIKSGELETIRQRHAVQFMQLAEEADQQLRGPQQVAWLEVLETENDNLRAALKWTSKNDLSTGLRLASALWWFWITRGNFTEGRDWLEIVLAHEKDSPSDQPNATAYARYGFLMGFIVDNQRLMQLAEEGLRRARQAEDPESMAISLLNMAGDPYYSSDVQHMRSLLEESLKLFQEIGNRWGMATALRALAEISVVRLRNPSEPRELGLKALALSRESGDLRGISKGLFLLGENERRLGNVYSANAYFQESLSFSRELKDRYAMALVLWKMSGVALHKSDFGQAIRLREVSTHIFREIHHLNMWALCIGTLAYVAFLDGQSSRALELCQESLKVAKEINSPHSAINSFLTLGELSQSQGDPYTAFANFREFLSLIREHSLTQDNLVYGCEALARLAASEGQVERSVTLLSAAESLCRTMTLVLIPKIRENWEASLNHARNHLDEASFTVAWEAGRSLAEQGAEHLIAYAIGEVGE